jgi:hypothetical protein
MSQKLNAVQMGGSNLAKSSKLRKFFFASTFPAHLPKKNWLRNVGKKLRIAQPKIIFT